MLRSLKNLAEVPINGHFNRAEAAEIQRTSPSTCLIFRTYQYLPPHLPLSWAAPVSSPRAPPSWAAAGTGTPRRPATAPRAARGAARRRGGSARAWAVWVASARLGVAMAHAHARRRCPNRVRFGAEEGRSVRVYQVGGRFRGRGKCRVCFGFLEDVQVTVLSF